MFTIKKIKKVNLGVISRIAKLPPIRILVVLAIFSVAVLWAGSADALNIPSIAQFSSGLKNDGYTGPKDMDFTFLASDKIYISQNSRAHYQRNGLLATDVSTRRKPIPVRAPAIGGEEYIYRVALRNYPNSTGKTIVLSTKRERFLLGHVCWTGKLPNYVKTGDILGVPCMTGVTTGLHVHLEAFVKFGQRWMPVAYDEHSVLLHAKWAGKEGDDGLDEGIE